MLPALLDLMLALPFLLLGTPSPEVAPVLSQQIVEGRLGGDAQLEGGCVWLEAVRQRAPGENPSRLEPLWPEGYYVTFDPVRLWGPDDRLVAEEGDIVTVKGQVRSEIITICQVGTPYEVQRILTVNGRFIPSR